MQYNVCNKNDENNKLYAFPVVTAVSVGEAPKHKHMCMVKVNGREVDTLLDSSSMITLVAEKLVATEKLDKYQDICQ